MKEIRALAFAIIWGGSCIAMAGGALDSTPIQVAQAPVEGAPSSPGRVLGNATGTPRTEMEIGATHESLTNGLPDWTSAYVEGVHSFKPRQTLYGGLRETRRFGLDDSEAYGALYYPLGETWTGVVEGSVSPTYSVLAKYSIGGQLLKSLPGGWGIGAGIRHSEYDLSAADVGTLMAERYWSNFRGAYTFYSGHPEGSSSAPAHRFQFAYYYGDRNWVGLSYTTGREVEYVGPPRGTITSDVRDWTLSGRHWLAPQWALTYDLVNHEQGILYRRQGGRIGIRHLF